MSLNIVVCEDNEKDAKRLEALLDIVCREQKLAVQICRFFSAEEFFASMNTPPRPSENPDFQWAIAYFLH